MSETPDVPKAPQPSGSGEAIGKAELVPLQAYREFELDLTRALLEHLPPILDDLTPATLTRKNVLALPEEAQGVYMLLEKGLPMYIGKTDAEHGFRTRLYRHLQTLSARKNVDLSEVSFKAVRIMVFTTINVEATLIKHFLGNNKMAWQKSGFGSNDPGHNRETQEPSLFDLQHPINIDLPLDFVKKGSRTALDLLVELKERLPYDFRYETDPGSGKRPAKYTVGHADQREGMIVVPQDAMTLRELLGRVLVPTLQQGWVATIFPGRVIFYKETTKYRFAVEQIPT